ncbi:MAG: response regulator transcription factor [Lachnotalea sp.]
MKYIVLVEDEVYIREELAHMLEKSGYHVDAIDSFDTITQHILESVPDLVLLDLNLPGISGFQICQEVKRKSSIPVLVLTSRDQMKDELHALELGADEYLTKPCRKERLLARISNVLKRYEGRANLLEGDGFLLDRLTYTLYINNQSTILPKNQGKLLEVFLLHKNGIVAKDKLNIALWGTTEFIDENALQVNLTRLRKTMHNLNMIQTIVAVSGKGYEITNGVPHEN